MEEVTVRLPTETRTTLQQAADERGVTLSAHVREIIEAYCASSEKSSTVTTEYGYRHRPETQRGPLGTSKQTEEIGSFAYGSRSIIS